MKKSSQISITLQGQGKNAKEAFINAIGKVQSEILKDNENIILRIEPVNVDVIKSEVKIKKERFLFLFLPRVVETYFITLDVMVDVTLFELDSIDFKQI
ncbi:DUF4312 family protein [Vibrio sp. S11_S32]|uniref:DUF4312 family protein n=1 Tax=Vibrio sp. S11_S32 TaxID=2720225 RepID=UPI0016818D3C|nr:DUF4312 family protein [Vibrio sp. S11_S32]MBD1576496.1 DUF4312 family protein [Vibrio sp. S11_S32]